MAIKKNAQAREKVKRLSKTQEGKALLELLDLCGGNTAMARALNVNVRTVAIWSHRGQVSEQGAYLIEETPFFAEKGWTKERVRPDIQEMQWGERTANYGSFLSLTKEDVAESQRRNAERLQKAADKKTNAQLEHDRELLARLTKSADDES